MCLWRIRNRGLHILHSMPWTRCKCLLTRVWTMSKKLRSFENEYQTLFLSARPNWFIRWLKYKIKIRISVEVKMRRDTEISGFGRLNPNTRMSWTRLKILLCPNILCPNIFTLVIGSIDYVTPRLWTLLVKPKLIEIKVSDTIQPVGNATAKITFSLSSKVSRKCFGTVMLVARASFALLIGRLNSGEKNRNKLYY